MPCNCQRKARQLIEEWYKEYVKKATKWATSDNPFSTAFDEALMLVGCMVNTAYTFGLPEYEELKEELWAVVTHEEDER